MTRRSNAAAARVPALVVSALLSLFLLAGCSFFSHSVTWTKSGVSEDQAQSDLAQCKEVADTQTERDRNIDRDIEATNNDANAGLDTSPIQNMQSYHDDRRYKSILRDCMTSLGYGEVE
jgi:hypothetical protein